MKLKPVVVAVLLALSTAPAWAADESQAQGDASRAESGGNTPEADSGAPAEEQMVWQYVNGQFANKESAHDSGQAAAPAGDSSDGDQSANSEDSSDNDQSTEAENAVGKDQAATTEASDDERQSAKSKDADEDRVAMAEESAARNQASSSEVTRGPFNPSTLEDFKAATQDKLVVILPSGWQGSVPELIAALEDHSDASEILILSQDENANDDDNDEDGEQ
jgi:hypothetical protein